MTAHGADAGGQGQGQAEVRGMEGGGGAQGGRTHLSVAGLRARGWAVGMVRQLLGEPDVLGVNPYSRAAPRIGLYRVERVEAAERSEEFRAVTAAAARRSATARGVARRRRREVLARIAAEPIDVPRLAPQELATLATEYRDETGVEGSRLAVGSAGPCGLDRWKVDFLRHQLGRYEALLKGLPGGSGRAAAEELLRRRVYGAIAEAYPSLAGECERQLSERAEKRMRAPSST